MKIFVDQFPWWSASLIVTKHTYTELFFYPFHDTKGEKASLILLHNEVD